MARQPDLFAEPRPTIDELRAKHGPTWGLKTTADLERAEARNTDDRRQREMRDRQVLAEYAKLGLDPVHASDGTLVSPALLRSIGRMPKPPPHNRKTQ